MDFNNRRPASKGGSRKSLSIEKGKCHYDRIQLLVVNIVYLVFSLGYYLKTPGYKGI